MTEVMHTYNSENDRVEAPSPEPRQGLDGIKTLRESPMLVQYSRIQARVSLRKGASA